MRISEWGSDVCSSDLQLLAAAGRHDWGDAFFVHYAPNLGRDERGDERMRPGDTDSAGTHDFQFMLKGAVRKSAYSSSSTATTLIKPAATRSANTFTRAPRRVITMPCSSSPPKIGRAHV